MTNEYFGAKSPCTWCFHTEIYISRRNIQISFKHGRIKNFYIPLDRVYAGQTTPVFNRKSFRICYGGQ